VIKLAILIPITVADMTELGAYTFCAVVPTAFRKLFLNALAIKSSD
jgi:hypothetical protein